MELQMINLSGNSISKVWRQHGYICKRQPKFLCENEIWCLQHMYHSGYVPFVQDRINEDTIIMEDLGKGEKIINRDVFMAHLERILRSLKLHGIRHGDLTEPNIIVRNDIPYIIDFAESRLLDDPRPDKRPEGDEYWLKKTMQKLCAKI